MATFLEKILARKKEEVGHLRRNRAGWGNGRTQHRPFMESLIKGQPPAIIAEVKKASPSKGIIRPSFDPCAIARSYEKAGADALSVLTDEQFFQGSIEHLTAVRETTGLPVLRKDFIVDTIQIEQTAAIGADAVLLIAAAVDDVQLRDLYEAAQSLRIEPLLEIHNTRELDRAMRFEPPLIGVNNRDLFTFVTDINVTIELMKHIPAGVLVVSESGIHSGNQARKLSAAGVRALLVGEALMRLEDPSTLIKELRE